MDTDVWQAIIESDYAVPPGSTVADLTPGLIASLGSVDPRVRDALGFPILAVWIDRGGCYTPEQLREIGARMIANLDVGLGESGTDTVFGRAFSALVLGKVIDADTRQPFLSAGEVWGWLDRALSYVRAERDVRGFVPGKGWAHAVAHMGDLMMYMARNRHVSVSYLERILEAIGARMAVPVPHVFRTLEDERMAYAVVVALQRELLALPFLSEWVGRLARRWPGGECSAWITEAETANAYYNTRQFFRSLYFQLREGIRPPFWYGDPTPFEHVPRVRQALLERIAAGLRVMDVGFYAVTNE